MMNHALKYSYALALGLQLNVMAAVFVNGGFEAHSIGNNKPIPAQVGNKGFVEHYNQSDVAGWSTRSSRNQIQLWATGVKYKKNTYNAFEGNTFAWVSSRRNSTLSQTMTGFNEGEVLDFKFAHMSSEQNTGIINLAVVDLGLDGVEGGDDVNADTVLFEQAYSSLESGSWTLYEEELSETATGNDINLSFTSLSSPSTDNFIDGVSFNTEFGLGGEGAVPEPSSLVLMLLGMALLQLHSRKRLVLV